MQEITLDCDSNRAAQLRCAELQELLILDSRKYCIQRKQRWLSIALAIKLHNLVVQSYNELLILDCASNRVRQQSSAQAIKLHNFVVQSYNELLILDCASNRVHKQSSAANNQ